MDGGAVSEEPQRLKLYSNWRSSCSWRVHMALYLKGLKYECINVDLAKREHYTPEFLKLNPLGFVPVLVDDDLVVSDSFAILMYLEDKYHGHPLLPRDLHTRAINYQAASIVYSSIQPLQNISLAKCRDENVKPDGNLPYHIGKGFAALEKLLKGYAGKYATGDEIFLADLFLAPQIYGAIRRFNINMTEFPLLCKLNEAYRELPVFQDTLPEKHPDAGIEDSY